MALPSEALRFSASMRPFLVLLVVLTFAFAFAGCSFSCSIGSSNIDSAEAEETISGGLEAEYGQPPRSLTCPDDVEPVEGETFTCEGEDPEGRQFEIEVEMTDDEGGIRYPTVVEFTDEPTGSST